MSMRGAGKPDSARGEKSPEWVKRKRFDELTALKKSPAEVEKLWKAVQKTRSTTSGKKMDSYRANLPAAKSRDKILRAVASNQVLLISGDTGCGKTTQVPQYILDDAWENKRTCRILCTQPRRIAATMVAARVADERGESLGKTVGYRVMLDKVGGPESALIYATTGVMLKDLTNETFDGEWTHLIIDEVHERDHNSDFLLIILRNILPKHPNLKVILMSATLHKDLFVEYFGNCPSLHIEGRTFPVHEYYLEDIIAGLHKSSISIKRQPYATSEQRQMVEKCIEDAFLRTSPSTIERLEQVTSTVDGVENNGRFVNLQHSDTGLTALCVAVIHGMTDLVTRLLDRGADPKLRACNGFDCRYWAEEYDRRAITKILDERNPALKYTPPKNGDVDYALLVNLIKKICTDKKWDGLEAGGSILVFLSGWKEIVFLRQQLLKAGFSEDKADILCLHSTIAPREQKLAFQPAPPNKHKIVLSTPIAETSITINDITTVINCGKMKEKSFDAEAGVSTLQSRWISKANQTQRAGRAGRCQEGIAFHVYTYRESERLDDFIEPEICRISLEEICLQARVCLENYDEVRSIRDFLQKAPNPPSDTAVEKAVTLLVEIGALMEDEHLTVLGRRLASLPMEPRTGKMILYGILFNCLDPILTITCAISHRSPWVMSIEEDEKSKKIRTEMSAKLGGCSDHLATVQAFISWQKSSSKNDYCFQNFLSREALYIIEGLRKKILGELKFRGMPVDNQNLRENSSDAGIVRSLLACGLYPMVGFLKRRGRLQMKNQKVDITGSSINSTLKVPESVDGQLPSCPLLVCEDITKGDFKMYVRETTALQPHLLPIIASQLQIKPFIRPIVGPLRTAEEYDAFKELSVDGWLPLVTDAAAAQCLAVLRIRLQDAFARKVLNPRNRMPAVLDDALSTILKFFSNEGAPEDPTVEKEKASSSESSKKVKIGVRRAKSDSCLKRAESDEESLEAVAANK